MIIILNISQLEAAIHTRAAALLFCSRVAMCAKNFLPEIRADTKRTFDVSFEAWRKLHSRSLT